MPTLDATVGGAAANSYETLAEANTYHDERIPLTPPWVTSGDIAIRSLITATKRLDAMSMPYKAFVPARSVGGVMIPAHYRTRRQWAGAPATTTQRLAWPRTGMKDANGNDIPSDVIPQLLKDAESELAGYLQHEDLTLDNTVAVQGITELKAGSVALKFKDDVMISNEIPQAVLNMMPPWWFLDEEIEDALSATAEINLL
jgi:hypothetical protein